MTKAVVTCRDENRSGYHRHRRYSLTCDEFEELWQQAQGRCQICGHLGDSRPDRTLNVDHDSNLDRSAVRGLLCSRCNARLHESRHASPKRDHYLANPWYLTAPGRPTPKSVENIRLTRWEANRLAADVILEYAERSEHRSTLRAELRDIARQLTHKGRLDR